VLMIELAFDPHVAAVELAHPAGGLDQNLAEYIGVGTGRATDRDLGHFTRAIAKPS